MIMLYSDLMIAALRVNVTVLLMVLNVLAETFHCETTEPHRHYTLWMLN